MNILVIKHGALGDFVMASGAMKSIRNYFPEDNILLLTEEKNIRRGSTNRGGHGGLFVRTR